MNCISKHIGSSKVEIPEYGDVLTLQIFINYCLNNILIDYDGVGNYATEKEMSDEIVFPSHIVDGKVNYNYTHVVWFNK